jgi:hypothetical protein
MGSHAFRGILAVLLAMTPLVAGENGSITGIVTGPNGEPSGGAEIQLLGNVSGASLTLTAGSDGLYRVISLPPGSYTIFATSMGTRASASRIIELHDGENMTVAVRLAGGWTVAQVTNLSYLPFAGGSYLDSLRNQTEITRGAAGGDVEGFGPYSPRGNFAVNSIGQRSQGNSLQVDGMGNNEPWLRGLVLNPSPESIETVTLTAVYTPATEGHLTGAMVDLVTRSGTGAWHGAAFDALKNSALDARNFFDGANKPVSNGNQFGVVGGGPLPGRGWFFSSSVDAARTREGDTVISTVPTAAQKAGIFGTARLYDPRSIIQTDAITFLRAPFPQEVIPPSQISPQARNILAFYPDPNLPGLADNYRYTPSSALNGERLAVRTDKAISPRDTLFARINFEHNDDRSVSALPGNAGSDTSQHADNAKIRITALGVAAAQTFTIGPTLSNEVRAGFTRFRWTGTPADRLTDPSVTLAIAGLTAGGLPVINPEGYAQLGAAQNTPGKMSSASYEAKDTITWLRGRHAVVAGFEIVRRHVDGNATDYTSRGTFQFSPDYTDLPNTPNTGNSIASLLLGFPSEIRRDVQFQPYLLRGWELAGFIQDTFRLSRRLTVTAGLRYSYDPPVSEASHRMVNFNYSRTEPALNQFAGQAGVNAYGGLSFNKRTVAPRIGFALDIGAGEKTVLRGGFSQNYDTGSYMAEGALARNQPYESRLDVFNGSLQTGPSLGDALPAPAAVRLTSSALLNAAQGSIYAMEPKSYTPYADQWGLFLDHHLSSRLSVELSGSGSMGIHLYESYNINQPYPAPTPYSYERYPYPPYKSRVEYLGFAAGSTYYGGEVKVAGKLRSDLNVLATYRYAKSLDDATEPETSQESRPTGPQYIYELRGNRSASPFDVRGRLILSAGYDLPLRSSGRSGFVRQAFGNWRLDTLVTLQGGFPFTPQLAMNGLNNGGYQLPDRIGTGDLPESERSAAHWFNTSLNPDLPQTAFIVPALFQYGNSGFGIVRGPGLATTDGALSRTCAVKEKLHLQTRIEVTNLFNRTNLALPNAILGLDSSGMISHTATASRNLRAVARLSW